jgi:hypothetical protein
VLSNFRNRRRKNINVFHHGNWIMEYLSWETIGVVIGIFATIEGIRRHQANKIERIDKDLSEHKLKVAETYASKDTVNSQFLSVSTTINEVGKRMEDRLDGMNERLDRVIEAGHLKSTVPHPSHRRGS